MLKPTYVEGNRKKVNVWRKKTVNLKLMYLSASWRACVCLQAISSYLTHSDSYSFHKPKLRESGGQEYGANGFQAITIFLSCKMSLMGCFDKHATVSLQTTALDPLSCTNKPPTTHTQTLRRPILTIYPSVYTSDRSQRALWVQWSQWSSVIVNTTLITIEQLGATSISALLTSWETVNIGASVIISVFSIQDIISHSHMSI